MPSLLDFFGGQDPQNLGLLSAAGAMLNASGPSLRPVSFGQVLAQGLGGYQQGQQQAMAQQQARQLAELNGLRIKEATGELSDKEQARKDAEDYRQFMIDRAKGASAPMPSPQSAGAMFQGAMDGQPSAPVAQQAATPGLSLPTAESKMQEARDLFARGLVGPAKAAMAEAIKLQPEYSQTPQVGSGPDGKLFTYVLDKSGHPKVLDGIGVKPEMTEVDLGGTKQFVDKNRVTNGQTFNKTMTFADRNAASRLAFDQSQATENQDAVMDPLAIRMTAQQYLAGDTSALQNFGRGAQGAKNLNAVRLEIARQANAAGLNGADIAAKVAEFGGIKAGQRTAGTRSANIEIAANEASELAPLALEASRKVSRSGFLPFGKAQIMFNSNTNDPALREFAMANTALVNAYGQAMARGGTATVSDKDHAREMLATAFDQPSYDAAVKQMLREIKAAQAAPKAVRSELSSTVSGREKQAEHGGGSAGQFSVTAPNGKTYTFPDAKSLANFKLSAGIR